MPIESASSPATLRKTMRRVRLEKLWVMKKCHARGSQPMMRANPRGGATAASPPLSPSVARIVLGRGLRAHLGLCGFCGSIEHVVCRVSLHARVLQAWTSFVQHVSRPVRGHGSHVHDAFWRVDCALYSLKR